MRESRPQLAVLGLVIAVLVGVFITGFYNAPRLGLDLQGGLEIVLEARPKKGEEVTTKVLEDSVAAIRDRVDGLGVSEPEIRTQGTDQIAIALPGIEDPDAAVEVVGSTAQLFFYDFQPNLVGSRAYRNAYDLLRANRDLARKLKDEGKEPAGYFLFDEEGRPLEEFADSRETLLAEYDGKVPEGAQILEVPAGHVVVRGAPEQFPIETAETGRFDRERGAYVLLKDNPALRGDQIESATGSVSPNGGYATQIQCTGEGVDQFGEVSKKIAQRGALRGQPQHFAIVLDNEARSVPQIDYQQYPNGIQGSCGEISGADSLQDAQNLALVLNTGALPVEFEIVSKRQVSATLGQESLDQALAAGLIGLIIVLVYLALFYRFLGLIADIALLFYAFILYGIVVGMPIVLTLPGVAGFILTLGVAADANIIIFERIREEFRAGRSVRASIKAGYTKGLKGILDANVVTLITAMVLFVMATGGVRGFALLLGIGVILSMFTAVAATFALLGLLAQIPFFRHPRMIGVKKGELRFRLRWMRARYVMLGMAAAVVVVSALLLTFKGLNAGIDFRSGTKIEVAFTSQVSEDDVRRTLTAVDSAYSEADVQRIEAPAGTDRIGRSSFAIQLGELEGASQAAEAEIRSAFDQEHGLASADGEEAFSVQTIGPTFGRQIIQSAIIAVIVSIVLLSLYIWARFDGSYVPPVVAALLHDLMFALGAYSITGREFNSATVAALLTIMGYSLYDTVIVFDRVRENQRLLRKSSFPRIVDTSLNEVLTRSLNTSFVTLIPVIAIFFYGGETLKDFAYALIVGLVAGVYSSLGISAPLLNMIKGREEFWKRRSEAAAGGGGGGDRRVGTRHAAAGVGSDASAEPHDSTRSEDAIGVTSEPDDATARDQQVNEPESDVVPPPPQPKRDRRSRSARRKR